MDKNKQNFAKDINVPSKEQTNDSLKNSDKNFNENCTHNKEQIIIDGVNVGGCSVYKNGLCLVTKNKCNAVCDYASYYLREQLARKTQECEELKEENQKLEMQLCNNCGERDDYNIPCKMIRDLDYGLQKEIEENTRYRKALEEIEKEIRDFQCDNCEDYHCETCDMKDILDIINKAKGEE